VGAAVVKRGHFSEQEYRDQAAFRVALYAFLHYADEQAREVGLTPKQWLLLLTLRGHRDYPSVSIRDLADALQIRQSSTSLLVDRAVHHGYLRRVTATDDRRKVMVSLTESGQRLLDTVMEANRRELGRLNWTRLAATLRQATEQLET
jgi:DNA-binding MarR family transcriptional regulator